MSVLEELHGLEGRVAARLNELRPMVEEYRELEEVARRLGLETERSATCNSASAGTRTVRRGRRATASKQATRKRRAPRRTRSVAAQSATGAGGATRQEQIVELVKQRPGITVPELGKEFGVDATNLYRIVRRLDADGTIKKQGSGLHPA
jgi:hypothetical protein